MPYTRRSAQNLIEESYPSRRIQVTGNPIWEVLMHFREQIHGSDVLGRLGLEEKGYFLVTAHREENVDDPERLQSLVAALQLVEAEFDKPMIVSTHPRTRKRLSEIYGKDLEKGLGGGEIRWLDPMSLFDFVRLEGDAFCVLSDSGTVQEECCLLQVSSVTLRDTTERPETIDCGSNILAGVDPHRVLQAVRVATSRRPDWSFPDGYAAPNVSDIVARVLLGHRA
jgi:UDP-N-acetylglucosamine 2-epimerase (non-hydrolysing)